MRPGFSRLNLDLHCLKELCHNILSCFLGRWKLSLIGREPLNNSLPGQTNTKEARINQKGTRMVKDGEDYDGFQMTNLNF